MAIYDVKLAFDRDDTGHWLALNEKLGLTMEHKDRDTLIMEALEAAPFLAVHNCNDGHPTLVFVQCHSKKAFTLFQ
jgi:hypothetical protein